MDTRNASRANVVQSERVDVSNKAMTRPHVVIVGSGFGGLEAARAFNNIPVQLTVIDRRNHHLFQPLLYQVATAGLSPADISSPIRGILHKQSDVNVLLAEVTGVDRERQLVLMGERSLSYDYLIIATGAHENYFGHPEWRKLAPGLKSIEDATAIRRELLLAFEAAEIESDLAKRQELLTFVLVGAGPTGVEMAGAIAELAHRALAADFNTINPRSARIILVEAGPKILPSFPEKLSHKAQAELTRLGVEVWTDQAVEMIEDGVVTIAGKPLRTPNVIWTAGVAASPAGKWLGVEVDRAGRVLVLDDLSIPGSSNVFVIGDTAHKEQQGKLLPGVAPVAMQQGRYVAALIRERLVGKELNSPFKYVDKGNLATVGRAFGIVDIKGLQVYGFLAWVVWLSVHIFYLIGFRNRVLVMIQWAWAYLTYQRGARIITMSQPREDG